MSQDILQEALMPSVLDRLIDPNSLGTSAQPWYNVDQLTRAVQRDLTALLNSRQTSQGLLDDYPQCRTSLLAFGLPDFTSLDASTAARRAEIGHQLEDVIQRYEPRLRDVHVTMTDPGDPRERSVHYLVEAMLNVDSAPDVAFEVILELATGQYDVEATRA
jgi:type VI secretion system protein ImpF